MKRLRTPPGDDATAKANPPAYGQTERTTSGSAAFNWNRRLVAIGASAGGVEALNAVISQFPANCPATAIVQHIPASFLAGFVERMNKISEAHVQEAYDGAPLEAGSVYVAPADRHLEVRGGLRGYHCHLSDSAPVNGFRPSVDVLFASLGAAAGAHALGVIVSGMGRDGVAGLKAMREAGAKTLGQDERSSIVYGMPRAAFEMGAVERQVPLKLLANEILTICNICRTEMR
jgi:two-component system chemotaxis response regulator CheB